jgi:hypothetical protein
VSDGKKFRHVALVGFRGRCCRCWQADPRGSTFSMVLMDSTGTDEAAHASVCGLATQTPTDGRTGEYGTVVTL